MDHPITTPTLGAPLVVSCIPGLDEDFTIKTVQDAERALVVLVAYRRHHHAVSTPVDDEQRYALYAEEAITDALLHALHISYLELLNGHADQIADLAAEMGTPDRIDVAEQIRRSVR